MAGNILENLGTNGQTFTLTIASLTNNSLQQSTAIDNTSNLFQDVLVMLKVKSGASGTAATGLVNVYVYATVDNGTTYTDGATGTNGSFTPTSPTNLRFLGMLNVVANATTYIGGPWSIAAAFGGVMPAKWGIVIENKTGGTLDTTAGNHSALYQGIYSQYT